jgi:hypothetical protein
MLNLKRKKKENLHEVWCHTISRDLNEPLVQLHHFIDMDTGQFPKKRSITGCKDGKELVFPNSQFRFCFFNGSGHIILWCAPELY